MGIVSFTKVQRTGSHVILALFGESGSGKTYSAILLGRGLVGPEGKLALLDTETGRGKIYAKLANGYDYAELTPPYTPERYVESIKSAEDAGYGALIIDSLSHEWEGIGGVIEDADNGKNKDGDPLKGLVKWAKPKARHKRFVQALLNTRMHLIICMRAKEKLTQKGDKIVSEGYVSVQDKRFIYETTVQLFMPNDSPSTRGIPRLDKCPEDLLGAFKSGEKITVDTGKRISEWVAGGVPVDHAFEALKREAEEAADGGTDVLKALWERLTNAQKKALAPQMENLKSIAKTADTDAAAEQSKPAPTSFTQAQAQPDEAPAEMFPADADKKTAEMAL